MKHQRMERGFAWPDDDIECARAVFRTLDDLDLAMACCKNRRVAIQAGGNCGVWPAHMAAVFRQVWTFEPDRENYDCLVQNVPDNVVPVNQALGSSMSSVHMFRDPKNCGAYFVDGIGNVPMQTIDSFDLANVDFICLDVEGFEKSALTGASETIKRCHPVIHIEDKGLSDKYGVAKGETVDWLIALFGYEVRHRVRRDVILT